jgi:phosphatidylinositol-3-phosphatase
LSRIVERPPVRPFSTREAVRLAASSLGAALAVTLAVTLAVVCSGAPRAAQHRSATPAVRLAATSSPTVTKLLVFMVENHSLSQMQAQMPWTYRFATRHEYATDYVAIRHPSLPNYLAIAGGSTFGVTDDELPAAHRLPGHSVFGQALAAGRTAKVYADGMPEACARYNGGVDYAARHNPWTYFPAERSQCLAHDVRLRALADDVSAGRLPNAGMVVPNLVHDAHDGTLAQADAWLKAQIARVQQGPDWTSGRLAVVITADEDDSRHGNRVLTVVASRYGPVRRVTTGLDHYSLTRLYDDVLGVGYLRNAATATSMTRAFGIRVRPRG